MARSINPSQQKLAERLTILNDRGVGMLTRIYNIKKVRFPSVISSLLMLTERLSHFDSYELNIYKGQLQHFNTY